MRERLAALRPNYRRLLVALACVVFLAGLAWILVTGLMAKREIAAAQRNADAIKARLEVGDLAGAAARMREVSVHARRAHARTTGPAWWVASQIPWIGSPVVTVRGCAEQLDAVSAGVLKPLVTVAGSLDLNTLVDHGTIHLQPFLDTAPAIRKAQQNLAIRSVAVSDLSDTTWLKPVNQARDSFGATLSSLQRQLDSVQRLTGLAPKMLGASGPQRYFIGLENEAESRGLGGIPGAFVIVTANHGTVAFEHFESDTTLSRVRTNLNLGAGFQRRYGSSQPANVYPNSTISPDFSDAARIWSAMWTKYSGETIDGAVAIDPTAISYLLEATGPAKLPNGELITGGNVVSLTEQSLYARFPDTAHRKTYLLGIAAAIANKLVAAPGSSELIRAAAKGASERRLLLWSASPSIESQLATTSVGGLLKPGLRPFAGFTTINATGGKLDYYLHRSMSYTRSGCGSQTHTTAQLTLTNAVPPGPLPSYVALRLDHPAYRTRPGDNNVLVSYYATPGSTITSVTVDGKVTIVAPETEKGLVVFTIPLELPRGSTRTVTVELIEPQRSGSVQLLRQPAVSPLTVTVQEAHCG